MSSGLYRLQSGDMLCPQRRKDGRYYVAVIGGFSGNAVGPWGRKDFGSYEEALDFLEDEARRNGFKPAEGPSVGRINSRVKGAVGEREVAAILREHGIAARRGQQFSGSPDSPDVVADMPGVHLEVKRVETFSLRKALEQAERDSGETEMAVVLQRGNRQKWVAVMSMDDFVDLYKRARRYGE